jgi:hypothetical protein
MKNYSVLLPVSPTYNDKTIFILVYNKLKIDEGYQSDTLLPTTSGSRLRRDNPISCRVDKIRTCDPTPPRRVRYRAAPPPENLKKQLISVLFSPGCKYRVKRNFQAIFVKFSTAA